eukprot:XP_028344376.1 uncharacterized protein LOC114486147 [Physeter catodon]
MDDCRRVEAEQNSTARVQEVELPVDVTHVHVEKVEVQAPHEIPVIQPRELGVHQQTKRNNPSPVDVFTVQKYQLPRLRPKYYDVEVPIYVPRYVEVPVPSHFIALNHEPLPDTLQLGPSIRPGLPTAPVPADNQVYSLAQTPVGAAQQVPQRGSDAGQNNSAVHPQFVVHTPGKESARSAGLAYFFPSPATGGPCTDSSSCGTTRPAYFLTPSNNQRSTAPSEAASTLQRQDAPAATSAVESERRASEVPHGAGTDGVASLGRVTSSHSVTSSSTDQATSSICSPSLVPAARDETAAAGEQQPREGEQLQEAANLHEKGQPPVIEIIA